MDKFDNIKIIIEDIISSQYGLHLTFKIYADGTIQIFNTMLKYKDITNLDSKAILDLGWGSIQDNFNGWLNTIINCKNIFKYKDTEYKPNKLK